MIGNNNAPITPPVFSAMLENPFPSSALLIPLNAEKIDISVMIDHRIFNKAAPIFFFIKTKTTVKTSTVGNTS